MKLLIWSDLHLEFAPFSPPPSSIEEADVLVLAGDVHQAYHAISWIRSVWRDKPVVYVAGNHEFYSGHWDFSLGVIRQDAAEKHVHFLENDQVVLEGVRFLGCTMWTDFEALGDRPLAMADYERGLNDCRMISAGPVHDGPGLAAGSLRAKDVLDRHLASRRWLYERLASPFPGKSVVVTHHLPSMQSVPDRYRNNRLTPGFASDLPPEMMAIADVWVHGHAHDSCDYLIEHGGRRVRVICNPRGYPRLADRFENQFFDPGLSIDI
jgi:hypothetical protein